MTEKQKEALDKAKKGESCYWRIDGEYQSEEFWDYVFSQEGVPSWEVWRFIKPEFIKKEYTQKIIDSKDFVLIEYLPKESYTYEDVKRAFEFDLDKNIHYICDYDKDIQERLVKDYDLVKNPYKDFNSRESEEILKNDYIKKDSPEYKKYLIKKKEHDIDDLSNFMKLSLKYLKMFLKTNEQLPPEIIKCLREYNNITSTLDLELMENESNISDSINIAVDWWADAVRNPKRDIGDDKVNMMIQLATMGYTKNISEEDIKKFKEILANGIKDELQERNRCDLRVDYHAEPILANAGREIGLDSQLDYPFKTHMIITPNEVKVSSGYGAEYKILWSSNLQMNSESNEKKL